MTLKEKLVQTAKIAKEKAEQDKEPIENNTTKPIERNVAKPIVGDATEPHLAEQNKKEPLKSELTDEQLFGILTDKVGRTITSFDDLNQVKEVTNTVEVEKYASPEMETYANYLKDTHRPMSDFVALNKDWDKEPEDVVAMGYIKNKYKTLTDEQVRFSIDSTYKSKPDLDPDIATEEEIASHKQDNIMKGIEWQKLVGEARDFYSNSKNKYYEPLQNKINSFNDQAEKGKQIWKESIDKSIPQSLEFDDFKYTIKDPDSYKESLGSLDNFLDRYKTEQGVLDAGKLAKTIIAGESLLQGQFLNSYGEHIKAKTIKQQLADKSNFSDNGKNPSIPKNSEMAEKYKQEFLDKVKNKRYNY